MRRAETETAKDSPRRAITGRDGFTLIEVLVAFLVLTMVGLAVQRAVVTAASGSSDAEARIQAEMVARTMLDAPLGRGNEALRPQSGTMSGMRWAFRLDPVSLPFPTIVAQDGKAPGWRLFRMTVTVSENATGRGKISIETLRLVQT